MLELVAMSRNRRSVEFGLLGIILIAAAFFRWWGLTWDSGYLFHPDERQILLVISKLQLPAHPAELFSPTSPLNPKFFAYGSFPLYLLRLLTPFAPPTNLVGPWADDNFARWVFLGRALSGFFDLGTVALTYVLGRRMYSATVGLITAACVAVTVLHVQLSHFYAVDTLLAFFTLATFYSAFRVAEKPIPNRTVEASVLRKRKPRLFDSKILCGVCFGLALATKITAFVLVVPIWYSCYYAATAPNFEFSRARILEIWRTVRRPFVQIVGVAVLVLLVTQPYMLIDWYTFGRDVIRETLLTRGWLDYPYTRQYAGTIPFMYQVTQGGVWAMGLPLGLYGWGGAVLFIARWWKMREWRDTFMLSFALIYFLTISLQYTKYLRYLLPLTPVLYLMATVALARIFASRRLLGAFLIVAVLVLSFLYALSYLHIYMREHPWLTASRWIYENVPVGKTLTVEEWDDALPTLIRFPGSDRRASDYTQIALPMYDEDTDAKRAALVSALAQADIVTLASQRLYASIGKLPERYPMTNRYYEKLFNGELGFEPVMTTRTDLKLGNLVIRDNPFAGLPFDASKVNELLDTEGLQIWNWGFADESFSVYDHPQPIVFQKVRSLSAAELDMLLR